MPDRVKIPSVIATSARDLEVSVDTNGNLSLAIRDFAAQETKAISVNPDIFASQLNLLPGYAVGYVKPIEIPQYLGAVVERPIGGPKGVPMRYVRVAHDADTSLPWVLSKVGTFVSNDDIAGVLANGGYEREPEFPRR